MEKTPYIVGFGIACIDYIAMSPWIEKGGHGYIDKFEVQGGGLTGTSIVAASRLGARTKFLGRVGDDEIGRMVDDGLKGEGVDTSGLIYVSGGESLFSWVHVDSATGERTIYCRRDCNMDCSADLVNLDALEGADALLLDAHWPEGARAAAERANRVGVSVVADVKVQAPEVQSLLSLIDYPVVSRMSALKLSDKQDYSEALEKILSFGCKAAVITCGEDGAYYANEAGAGHVPAFKVDVVDTTGAGDVFHGAFAVGLAKGWELRDIITFASAVSAIKCTQLGGRAGIPDMGKALDFLKRKGIVF